MCKAWVWSPALPYVSVLGNSYVSPQISRASVKLTQDLKVELHLVFATWWVVLFPTLYSPQFQLLLLEKERWRGKREISESNFYFFFAYSWSLLLCRFSPPPPFHLHHYRGEKG